MEDQKNKKLKKPNGFKENPTKPKKADNDDEDDNDNEDDSKKRKKKKVKTFEDVFNENKFSERIEETLKDFIDMRKTIKKPMTSKALELLIKNLNKLTNLEEEKIAILNQSIEHGWQTVYPLKSNTQIAKTNSKANFEQRQYSEEFLESLYANNNMLKN